VSATVALKQLAGTVPNNVMLSQIAARTAKPAEPTGNLGALLLGPEVAEQLGDGHAGLKLDPVEVHRVRSVWKVRQRYGA
jgi:hypothetical protein